MRGARPGRAVGELGGVGAAASAVPASSKIRSATSRRSSIGVDVPPVTPTTSRAVETAGVVEVAGVLDLDRVRAGDLAQPRQLLGVRRVAAADDDHQVDVARRLEGVLLAPDRDRADGVDDLELVAARDHERGELLELPGRLGRLGDQRHPLAARDPVPVLLLVDDDRVGREAEQADDLGVLRRAEQDDRVALLDELDELALLLDDPGAGAVDDLEAARLGALHDLGPDAVGADDDGRAVVDVVERRRRSRTPICWRSRIDALVVDDLAEGMRRLAGGRRLLGLVDRLAHAVAEAGALGDPDVLTVPIGSMIAQGPRTAPGAGRMVPSGCRGTSGVPAASA